MAEIDFDLKRNKSIFPLLNKIKKVKNPLSILYKSQPLKYPTKLDFSKYCSFPAEIKKSIKVEHRKVYLIKSESRKSILILKQIIISASKLPHQMLFVSSQKSIFSQI